MSAHPPFEDLEALALDELPAEDAGRIEVHAVECTECARELAWLRAEARLVRRRPQPQLPPDLWQKVERSCLSPSEGERAWAPIPIFRARRRTWIGASVAVAAAAALALVVRPGRNAAPLEGIDASTGDEGDEVAVDPRAQRAIDEAAGEYRTALSVLEQEYARARGRLDPRTQKRWDDSFARARVLVDKTAQAKNDVDERLKLLDGSAVMVRSLRHAIEESEEATP